MADNDKAAVAEAPVLEDADVINIPEFSIDEVDPEISELRALSNEEDAPKAPEQAAPKEEKDGEKDKEPEKKETKAPEQDDVELVFEQDAVIGDVTFSKDTLKNTPKEVLQGIYDLNEKLQAASTEHSQAKEKLDLLMTDPIVKSRLELHKQGLADAFYQVDGLTESQKAELKNAWDNGEDFTVVLNQLDEIAKHNGQAHAFNELQRGTQRTKQQTTIQKGRDFLLGLSELNPELVLFKERDIGKFFDKSHPEYKGESHPEYDKWQSGLGKVRDYFVKKGYKYEHLLNMTSKEAYALAAAGLDLPFATNTENRDRTIREQERNKIAQLFSAKAVSKAMSQKTALPTGKQSAPATLDNLAALDKSVINDDYLDRIFEQVEDSDDLFSKASMIKNVMNGE